VTVADLRRMARPLLFVMPRLLGMKRLPLLVDGQQRFQTRHDLRQGPGVSQAFSVPRYTANLP